ncbi:hypothetical protein [Marinimicrobium alkaliphilum]|uniref:hypothetical protein n=1 Tax=Marinimicrobium alkaliphilum TaxID=2202654 RepID=UPI00130066D9|nr:hypothetical protein [Marinimicrobium alkaliphilum]
MKQAIVVMALLMSSPALACSFARTLEDFEIEVSESIEPKSTKFEVTEIVRGQNDGDPYSCSDAGVIILKAIEMPPDTGFIFKLVKGEFEDMLFEEEPVVPSGFVNPNEFVFIWLDGSSYEQEAFDIEVQITPVSRSGTRGEPTYLNISHPGRERPWWRFW